MSVGLLLISHQSVASNLLETAQSMLGQCALYVRVLEVPLDQPVDQVRDQAECYIQQLNEGDGVLILSDLFGGTPSNIGHGIIDQVNIKMVSGLNLPMLVKVLNYPDEALDDIAAKAHRGGTEGIVICDCK